MIRHKNQPAQEPNRQPGSIRRGDHRGPGIRRRAAAGLLMILLSGLAAIIGLAGTEAYRYSRDQAQALAGAETRERLDRAARMLSLESIDLAQRRGSARTAEAGAGLMMDGSSLQPPAGGVEIAPGILAIPPASSAPRRDGWGREIGYCPGLDASLASGPDRADSRPLFLLVLRDDPLWDEGCAALLADGPAAGPSYSTRLRYTLAEAIQAVESWEADPAAPGSLGFSGSGNVGIGTATPSEKLEVAGNARVSGALRANAATITDRVLAGELYLEGDLSAGSIQGPSARAWARGEARIGGVNLTSEPAPPPEDIYGTIVLRKNDAGDGFEYYRDGTWHELVQDPTTPSPFTFTDVTEPPFGTACLVSDVVTPQGYREPGSIGIAPGSHASARYRIGSESGGGTLSWGGWQTNQHDTTTYEYRSKQPPFITPGQSVQLCVDTPVSFDTAVSAGLAIGRYQTFWTVTTAGLDETPVLPPFDDLGQDLACVNCPGHIVRGSVHVSNEIQPSSFNQDIPVSILSGPEDARISVNGGAWGLTGTLRVHPQTRVPLGDRIRLRMAAPAGYGETATVRIAAGLSEAEWSITAEPVDTLPAEMVLVSRSLDSPNGAVASEAEDNLVDAGHFGRWIQTAPLTPQDINHPLEMSVSSTGGTASLSVAGRAWAASESLQPGESFIVRMRTGTTEGAVETATIQAGDLALGWTLTSRQDVRPNSFIITGAEWVEPGSLVQANPILLTGFDAPLPASVTGGRFRINGGAAVTAGTLSPGDSITLELDAGTDGTVNIVQFTAGSLTRLWQNRSWYFEWESSPWSACSRACAIDGVPGSRTRTVVCRRSDGAAGLDSECDGAKPEEVQECSQHACTYGWVSSSWSGCTASPSWSGWSSCSASCGGGIQSRSCYNTSGTEYRSNNCVRYDDQASVASSYCSGSPPSTSRSCSSYCSGSSSQSCNTQSCCTPVTTITGTSACSASCGGGTHTLYWSNMCGTTWTTTAACNTQACCTPAPTIVGNSGCQVSGAWWCEQSNGSITYYWSDGCGGSWTTSSSCSYGPNVCGE